MTHSNVLSFAPRLRARDEAQNRCAIAQSAERFRLATRAVREMRERGAGSKEIAHTLRTIADELEGSNLW
jgi:hypothetical protein